MKQYVYDVFLSFTGADRELKNRIKDHLAQNGLTFYDSDMYCKGQFRDDFCQALDQSKVYLMLLTDNLRNDPSLSGKGALTEVRRECGLACELEAKNELNIVILCMSEFFRYEKPFHDYNDAIGWHFYTHTRGFSRIDGTLDESGVLSESTLDKVFLQCFDFVQKRNTGTPVISQKPPVEIASESMAEKGVFKGRDAELQQAIKAFSNGKQAVVLSGMGGMGKTVLATEIARECDRLGYLKCPQIVRIQELADSGNGLRTIVSSVNYQKNVYDSLSSLSEQDKYRRKLRALCDLPENFLLVVDNYNSVTEDDLQEVLAQLKCRILITTRNRLEFSKENISVISIDSLNENDAYEMFCEIYGSELPKTDFLKLYDFVGAHTITLCILAKMMSAHRLTADEMLCELGSGDSTEARVSFRHNEYGDPDTVLGHLKKLFDMSNFSDEAKNVLRSLSLLGTGTISLADLKRVLGLKNQNAVNELFAGGWIELLNKGEIFVYLHPILSRLIVSALSPSEQNTAPMIDYLLKCADEAKHNITFTDALVLEDCLYYALYTLGITDKKLSRELWKRFVDINHLLGDVENTKKKVQALASKMTDQTEKAVVSSYGYMMELEHHPTRGAILEKFVQAIEQNAVDHKWLLRALSVTFAHIKNNTRFHPVLKKALNTAIDSAMSAKDDLALVDLSAYFFVMHSGSDYIKKLEPYVLRQRASNEINGAFLLLEMLVLCCKTFPSRSYEELSESINKMIADISDTKYFGSYKIALSHPFVFRKIIKSQKDAELLPKEDPLSLSLSLVIGESENLVYNQELDARKLIDAALNLYIEKVKCGNTFASARNSISGIINIVSNLPQAVVKKCTAELVEGADGENISVKTLSSLQTASLINGVFGDRVAIDQSLNVIGALLKIRPESHSDLTDAYIYHADLCSAFGDSDGAFEYYLKAYKNYIQNAEDSAMLPQISRKILSLGKLDSLDATQLCQLKDGALMDLQKNCYEYTCVARNFVNHICSKVSNKQLDTASPEFQSVFEIADQVASDFASLDKHGQLNFVYMLSGNANTMCNCKQFETAERFVSYFGRLSGFKSKRNKRMSSICHANNNYYIAYCQRREDADELIKKYISLCIKFKSDISGCCVAFWLLLTKKIADLDNSVFEATRFIIKSNAVLSPVLQQLEDAMDSCINLSEELKQQLSAEDCFFVKKAKFAMICRSESELLYKNNFGITPKEFSKLRSADKFYAKAISNLVGSLLLRYGQSPIELKAKH